MIISNTKVKNNTIENNLGIGQEDFMNKTSDMPNNYEWKIKVWMTNFKNYVKVALKGYLYFY